MNILLLEDDEVLAEAMIYKLTAAGHSVYYADDGKQAVAIVLENPVDLVISDLMIPVISGIAFLGMRHKFIPENTPVIAMSVLDNAEEILSSLNVDVRFFLRKPVDFERLMDIIDQLQIDNHPGTQRREDFLSARLPENDADAYNEWIHSL